MRRTCITLILALTAVSLTTPHPLPEEVSPDGSSTTTESSESSKNSAPSLIVVDDDEKSSSGSASDHHDDDDAEVISSDKQKRHRPTPSPAELEERRKALIKALGGDRDSEDGGGGGGQLAAGLMGLGSLATDVVSLITSNANETFAPLREARLRARNNFPDFGTQVNRALKNGREYAGRAYRGLVKNARVKITNAIRFMLAGITRLASTVGGLYQILVSLLDVATRGIGVGARFGARALAFGSNYTVNALARGTGTLRSLASSGILVKPANQAVQVGRDLSKGITDDLFDKVEWAQEGINSKLELAQALAPNFLLHAHEKVVEPPASTDDDDAISIGGDGSEPVGGYSKLTANEDEMVLLSLASTASELMQRGGRDISATDKDGGGSSSNTTTTPKPDSTTSATTTTSSSTTTTKSTTPPPDVPPQGLLNDIFGLQEEINELKNSDNSSTSTTETSKKS